MRNKIKIALLAFVMTIVNNSCTEPYELKSNIFEKVLVIEATIINELKHQEVNLSRSFRLNENSGSNFESGATVKIISSDGTLYLFEELNQKYISIDEFEPAQNVSYQLFITTADGKNYTSTSETITAVNQIESVNTTVETKDGERGVQISVNSYDPTNSSKFYRFTYEETYKVIAPKWSPNKITIDNNNNVTIVPRDDPETRICYKTQGSKEILIENTSLLSEDRILNFPIRFISKNDYTIANRYSILVKQYIQNYASYAFYKNLKKFSENGGLLSQTQPGFFYGNINSIDDSNEKVIGFFDVATVSTKRIFFNYDEIFPDELAPGYYDDCEVFYFDSLDFEVPGNPSTNFWALKGHHNSGKLVYYYNQGRYFYMVKPICGDCTSYASNVIPTFWQ